MKYILPAIAVALIAAVALVWLQNTNAEPKSYYGRILLGNDPADAMAWQHFIVKGDTVFIDQNKDQRAERSEQFDNKKGLQLTVAGRSFRIASAQPGIDAESVSESLPQRLQLEVEVNDRRPFRMAGKMLLTENPDDCNWLQFGGDLQFLVMDQPKLKAGAKLPAEVKIFIGTATSGPPSNLDLADDLDSRAPDMFRTAIVLPVKRSPYPTVQLSFDREHDGTPPDPIPMDQFC